MVMFGVVPGEKGLGPGARLEQAAEALREVRLILQGLELRFGKCAKRIVRDMGREWLGATRRSLINNATGLAIMGPPLSA